jgi:hypothetical protein
MILHNTQSLDDANTNIEQKAFKILFDSLVEELESNNLISRSSLNKRVKASLENTLYVNALYKLREEIDTTPREFLNTDVIGKS